MSAPVTRAALSFSRDLEFATETELAKRMGCSRHYWLRATLKELIDNALDACEEAGVAHAVDRHRPRGQRARGRRQRTGHVAGAGRAAVRPIGAHQHPRGLRGARSRQPGQRAPALMALPFGFGLEEAGLTITSQGVEHTITLRVNRLHGRIDLERTTSEVPSQAGNDRRSDLAGGDRPRGGRGADRSARLAQSARRVPAERRDFWEPTAAVTKWTPGGCRSRRTGTPPSASPIGSCSRSGAIPKITVAQFLATFKGLTSSTKRSEVAAAAGLSYQPLAALLDASGTELDRQPHASLLDAMQAASRPPKPAVLGAVGKETFEAWA